jgi:superfamily II DNA or RNA helicase
MATSADHIAFADGADAAVGALTRRDIGACTTRSAFSKGEEYLRQRRVLAFTIAPGGTIEGKVRGTDYEPYEQSIALDAAPDGTVRIIGSCSCPVGFNCKHVVAVLLAVIAAGERGRAAGGAPDRASGTLGPQFYAWLDRLRLLGQTECDDYPPEIRQRLIYVLAPVGDDDGALSLGVEPMSVRLLKDGRFSEKVNRYAVDSAFAPQPAKFLRPADRDVLRSLAWLRQYSHAIALHGNEGAQALTAMLATGRVRWETTTGPALAEGPPRRGRIEWRLAADGTQRPVATVEGAEAAIVARMAPPWYVDPAAGLAGPVETGFAPRIAEAVMSAPPVSAGQAGALRAAIAERLPVLSTIAPPEIPPPERIVAPLTPGLRLGASEVSYGNNFFYGRERRPAIERIPMVVPVFRYGGAELAPGERRARPAAVRDGKVFEVARDIAAERAALRRLDKLGLKPLSHWYYSGLGDDDGALGFYGGAAAESHWIELVYRHLPTLEAEGWIIEIEPDFPVRLVRGDGDPVAEIAEGSGIDWFELDLGIMVDGERVDLVPAILKLIDDPSFDPTDAADGSDDDLDGDRPIFLKLADGRILAMPHARLQPIVAALYELVGGGAVDRDSGRIGLTPLDAGDLAAFESATVRAGVAWRGGERLRELGRRLRDTGGIPAVAPPPDFRATLRPYQARGLDWLQFLASAGLGGVLADDMGLGKTVQALAHLAVEQAAGRMDRPALVIAPTSLVANWRHEAERFAPSLKVLTLHGPDRKTRFAEIAAHDLVLTTYPLLARDHDVLAAQQWHVVILDEAQTIKNPNAATTRLVTTLEARQHFGLTGTPLENHLGELWSLFAFVAPGFLGDKLSFARRWRTPIEKRGDEARRMMLARRIRPFLLRRTKAEVATELPPKTEIVETVEMAGPQRDVYESIRLAMHERVRKAIAAQGLARSHIVVLDALLKLRQACCDPRLLKVKTAKAGKAGSAKLDRLMDMLPALIEEGRRVLLFSQFTSMLALIEPALDAAGIPYALLIGSTRDRNAQIKRFQSGAVPLFLISLKAGGLGLNLTAADTVIHYDPWWNPAVEDQATDRAHRIGQDKPVFVHKLVVAASIEEKMDELKDRKRQLAAGLFDPDAGSTLDLTESDIDRLFAPA